MLAADDMLEFFMKILSEDIYNRAVDDAKNVVKQNFENLEVDLYLLLNKWVVDHIFVWYFLRA